MTPTEEQLKTNSDMAVNGVRIRFEASTLQNGSVDTDKAPLGLDQTFPEEELWALCNGDEFLCGEVGTDLEFLMDAYKSEADAFAGLMFAAGKHNNVTNQGESILSFRPVRETFDGLRTDFRSKGVTGVVVLDREGNEITRRYWD